MNRNHISLPKVGILSLIHILNDIQKRIDTSIQLPEGYHIEYGGQFESEHGYSWPS